MKPHHELEYQFSKNIMFLVTYSYGFDLPKISRLNYFFPSSKNFQAIIERMGELEKLEWR